MSVPAVNVFHRPILEVLAVATGNVSYADLNEELVTRLSLTSDDKLEKTPAGRSKLNSHIYNAAFTLKGARLVELPVQGKLRITPQGRQYLKDKPGLITNGELKRLASASVEDNDHAIVTLLEEEYSPEEQLDFISRQLREQLVDELLTNLKAIAPTDFERVVNRLLSRIGYGEIDREHGHSGDEGIDGVLNQDLLGLDKVYVQAKRYDGSQVREPEIRLFHSSLTAKGASKGVFITTSVFHNGAKEAAHNLSLADKFIRLIDGKELAELMISNGVGVVTEITYEVKKLDANYFSDL